MIPNKDVKQLPVHPVVAAAIAAFDRIRMWADGMLVGHTDFNKIFYEVLNLLGKIKAGNSPEEVARTAEEVAVLLCQHAEFFEQTPYNVTGYEELQVLGSELVSLRAKVRQFDQEPKESVPAFETHEIKQGLDPVLEAIVGIGIKLDSLLLQHVGQSVSIVPAEQAVVLVEHAVSPANDDLQEFTEILLRNRAWLHSTREFEGSMRDNLADVVEHQDGLTYGLKGADRSHEIVAIHQALSNLAEVRKPVEEANREIEGYIAARAVVNRGVQDKHRNVSLPVLRSETADSSSDTATQPKKEIPLTPLSKTLTTSNEPNKNRKISLVKAGTEMGSGPAEVFFVTLFELIPRTKNRARGYSKMMRNAFSSGLAQKFQWSSVKELEDEYQKGGKETYAKQVLLRMNGVASGALVLSRTATTLPWSVNEIFTEEEIGSFQKMFE